MYIFLTKQKDDGETNNTRIGIREYELAFFEEAIGGCKVIISSLAKVERIVFVQETFDEIKEQLDYMFGNPPTDD